MIAAVPFVFLSSFCFLSLLLIHTNTYRYVSVLMSVFSSLPQVSEKTSYRFDPLVLSIQAAVIVCACFSCVKLFLVLAF